MVFFNVYSQKGGASSQTTPFSMNLITLLWKQKHSRQNHVIV
jgi:hypothetical protein